MGPVPLLIDLSVARRADPSLWPSIGPKADTWGLGATVYFAVAKRLPHSPGRHDASGAERFPQLVESPAPLDPVRHSPHLAELIAQMLAREPARRPSVAEVFDRFDELGERAGVGKVRFR